MKQEEDATKLVEPWLSFRIGLAVLVYHNAHTHTCIYTYIYVCTYTHIGMYIKTNTYKQI